MSHRERSKSPLGRKNHRITKEEGHDSDPLPLPIPKNSKRRSRKRRSTESTPASLVHSDPIEPKRASFEEDLSETAKPTHRSNSSMELFRTKVVDPFIETYSQVAEQRRGVEKVMREQKEAVVRKFRLFHGPLEEPRYYTQTFRYEPTEQSWAVVPYTILNEKKFKGHHLRSLRLLTYNIWFHEDENFEARTTALLKILHHANADIVGLQEVTPRFLKVLTATSWIRENYYVTEITGNSFCGYGNILMTTMRPRSFYTRPLESLMGRQLIMSEFVLSTPSGAPELLRVGTVHLESLAGNYEIRNFQFKQIFPLLTSPAPGFRHVHSVLMGDFNLDPSSQEEIDSVQTTFGNDFVDCWTYCSHGSPGSTRYVNYPEEGKEAVRFDRIILSSKENRITPKTMVTVGSDALESPSLCEEYDQVFPSDHLGLLCECTIQYET